MKCQEVKIQVVRETAANYTARTPEDVEKFWRREIQTADWYQQDKEHFIVLILSAKNHIKSFNLVSLGLLNVGLVHAREVFRPAIVDAAAAVILVHNHPSGDVTPSSEDIKITKQMIEAGKIICIEVLDHVIIGQETPPTPGFTSMREQGIVEFKS